MTHLTDWQRGYQAGALQGRTQAAIIEGQRLFRQLTWLDTNRPDGLKGGHR